MKEYLLKTPMSDDDKKVFRAELKRVGVKVKEEFEKILTKYNLTDEQINSLNLNLVPVFKNIIVDGKSTNIAMVIGQNPIKWDR